MFGIKVLSTLILFVFSISVYGNNNNPETYTHNSNINDTSITNLLSEVSNEPDSLNIRQYIYKLIRISEIYTKYGQYNSSFSYLWDALELSVHHKDTVMRVRSYAKLSVLYEIYEYYDKALEFNILATNLSQACTEKEVNQPLEIARKFHSRGIIYKKWGKYAEAEQAYLTNLSILRSIPVPLNKMVYSYAQLGHIYTLKGELDSAYHYLSVAANKLASSKSRAEIIMHYFLGDYYSKSQLPNLAIEHYKKSMEASKKYNDHIDLQVNVLNNLSTELDKLNQYKEAYKTLLQAKNLSDSLFSSTSFQNKQLFEIKDTYKKKLKEAEIEMNHQQLTILKHKRKNLIFKMLLIAAIALVITISLFFYNFNLKKKHQSEKQLLQQRNELELKRKAEILEIKNKELTASALQVIDKDKLLLDIKEKLEQIEPKLENRAVVKDLVNSVNVNAHKNWKEFETRFNTVHDSFYNNLFKRFPHLTPSDLKMCSFIKLGLSGKEMAQLMGIGVQSLHTARSRLRKKLGLNREENLTTYIAKL